MALAGGGRIGRIWRWRELGAAGPGRSPASTRAPPGRCDSRHIISNLSHALRTPLGAVLGWAKALQIKRDDPATVGRGLDAIARNAAPGPAARRHARRRPGALGKVALELQRLDLAALVAAAVEAARASAAARRLDLQVRLDPIDRAVVGDADRLRQVVASLLANAVRFASDGGRIELLLRPRGGDAELVVRDDGAGIEPSRLPRLFEPHDPGDPSSVRPRGGLGLALPVARRLIELHGGRIEAASAGLGAGAAFTVRLPLAPEVPEPP